MIRALLRKPGLVFRFTPMGRKAIVLTLIIGAGALNTGVNLLYLVFALILGAILASGVLSGITLWNIEAGLRLPRGVFATKRFHGTVHVHNLKRRFHSYSVRVREVTHAILAQGAYFARVGPQQKCSLGFHHSFPRRGKACVREITLSTRFPFGLFEKRVRIPVEQELVVYPRVFEIELKLLGLADEQGYRQTHRRGHGTELMNLRDYAAGDHPKHIHWKSSARMARLMVREFSIEQDNSGILLFDNSVSGIAGPDLRFETGVCVVASIAAHLIKRKMTLDFHTLTQSRVDCTGNDGLFRILDLLAVVEPIPREKANDLPNAQTILHEGGSGLAGAILLGFSDGAGRLRSSLGDLETLAARLQITAKVAG